MLGSETGVAEKRSIWPKNWSWVVRKRMLMQDCTGKSGTKECSVWMLTLNVANLEKGLCENLELGSN